MLLKKLNTAQFVGIGLLISLLAFAFLQPFCYPVDENLQDLTKILQSGSSAHWFGTDHFGRDIFTDCGICGVCVGIWLIHRHCGGLFWRISGQSFRFFV